MFNTENKTIYDAKVAGMEFVCINIYIAYMCVFVCVHYILSLL